MIFGMIGSGSWGTALVKILTDNGHKICWCVRNEKMVQHLEKRHHNPNYLSSVYFDTSLLSLTTSPASVFEQADHVLIAIPSAYLKDSLEGITEDTLKGKKILSAVKGILPDNNQLLNDFLQSAYNVSLERYFTIMGPCHAEEVAAEKLSYLTFSGINEDETAAIANCFKTPYINTVVNTDVYGVQYAAVLKNIYALGSGIAHGLEYGDNFLSVFIANCADEMAGFLRLAGARNIEVGVHALKDEMHPGKSPNYAASVYMGDLLVTCYSLFSRNRTFGNMIGKGYSVHAARLEMNMYAEGYNASKCIFQINREMKSEMPIAETIYRILWEKLPAEEGFKLIEETLI
ncbi:NAD(P)H-dependent glycerol-3-phosphate dehydrogenase [Pollutibacter soli]|uniref:NAD(P)H-dependent glycerol-3-phosphate dehydrogenase n=1 Tax=Pollutibacter soli TaxID=3034157 RepID=UPI003013B683